MSYNGSGTFLINTAGQPVVSGTVISSTAFNALTADLATGLSTAITKDGQTTVTANIPMGTYKFTGLGAGTAATDSANLSQVQSTVTKLLASVSGADTITAVASPTLGAYAAGQMFYFVAAGDNTGAVTLNIDSLGAKSVTRDGSVALAASDIKSGEVVVVVYDGTRFQVVSQLNSAGDARFANVSITSALNVGGVATFSAGTAAAPSITTSGDTNTGIFFPAADTIAFAEGGVEALRITSAGDVGIGTSSPAVKLEVSRGSEGEYLRAGGDDTGNNGRGLRFTSSTNSGFIGAKHTLNAPSAGGAIAFATASTERAVIDSSGNLGINTASPAAKLDVNGASVVRGFLTTTDAIKLGANTSAPASTDAFIYRPADNTLAFGTANTERVRISSAGDVGIGTSNPLTRLHLSSTSATYIQITDEGDGASRIGQNGTALTFGVDSSNGATERARITAAGQWLVGKTTYSDTTVGASLAETGATNSTMAASANTTTTHNTYSTGAGAYRFYVGMGGTVYATNTTISAISDQRLKENVRDLDVGLDAVMALKPRKFDWKEGKGQDKKDVRGFIAQEFEQVFPDLIDEWKDPAPEGEEPYKSVRQDLIPVLVKAIQELKAELDAAKVKIAALEAK